MMKILGLDSPETDEYILFRKYGRFYNFFTNDINIVIRRRNKEKPDLFEAYMASNAILEIEYHHTNIDHMQTLEYRKYFFDDIKSNFFVLGTVVYFKMVQFPK